MCTTRQLRRPPASYRDRETEEETEPETVEEANAHPEVFADKSVGQVADHYTEIIGKLDRKPAVIGHSFGGLLTMIVAGRGVAAASVAIDSAPFRGVLPLPFSALKASSPVLGNPLNRHRAIPLTYDQFRFAFANLVSEEEAHELYDTFAVPASGVPLFQAAAANLNPWTEAKADYHNPERGPMLIIQGIGDNTSPPAINEAAFTLQQKNPGRHGDRLHREPAGTRSRSTAAGARSATRHSPSSGASPERPLPEGGAGARLASRRRW